jgi:hypothetical protein
MYAELLEAEIKMLKGKLAAKEAVITAAKKVASAGKGHAGKERYVLIEAAIKELEAALRQA